MSEERHAAKLRRKLRRTEPKLSSKFVSGIKNIKMPKQNLHKGTTSVEISEAGKSSFSSSKLNGKFEDRKLPERSNLKQFLIS